MSVVSIGKVIVVAVIGWSVLMDLVLGELLCLVLLVI